MNTKRIIALLLCAVMLLTMIPVMAISTAAATDGIWTTYRFAGEYPDPDEEEDPNEEPTIYKPEAGYEYTSEGFSVIGADYKNTTPSLTVITKEKQDIKDGIYLQFRIDDYSYDGGTGADQWICLSLTTGEKVAPGSTSYGGGWLTLVRGAGDGNCTMLPHLTDPKTEDFGGSFMPQGGGVQAPAELDSEGREIHTFEITWNGSEYDIKLNGVSHPAMAQTTALLEKLSSTGDFFIGITMMDGYKGGEGADLTILEYGSSAATATKPVGDDSKKPEENLISYAEIADPSTVPANTPAILWNPETYNLSTGNNVNFTAKGDNTWAAEATEALVFFNLSPKRSWSYDAEDFPVFGIMLRNIWVDTGMLWYAAGEYSGATDGLTLPFSVYDGEFYGEDEEYVFVPYDLTGLWEGRINSIRLDMNIADETSREFDLCFAGMFRSEDEAYAYAEAWMANILGEDSGDETTPAGDDETTPAGDDETTPAGDDVTTPAGDETTPAGEETTAATGSDETQKPTEDTTAAAGNDESQKPSEESTAASAEATTAADGEETKAEEKKSGCGAVVGFGAVAVLAAAAAAVALKKKD